MINLYQTLITNDATDNPWLEPMDAAYVPAALPAEARAVRAAFFGEDPDPLLLATRTIELLRCLDVSPLAKWAATRDPRRTDPKERTKRGFLLPRPSAVLSANATITGVTDEERDVNRYARVVVLGPQSPSAPLYEIQTAVRPVVIPVGEIHVSAVTPLTADYGVVFQTYASELNDTPGPPLLLEDGATPLLLEDGATSLLTESEGGPVGLKTVNVRLTIHRRPLVGTAAVAVAARQQIRDLLTSPTAGLDARSDVIRQALGILLDPFSSAPEIAAVAAVALAETAALFLPGAA